jgi:hypothetical protein
VLFESLGRASEMTTSPLCVRRPLCVMGGFFSSYEDLRGWTRMYGPGADGLGSTIYVVDVNSRFQGKNECLFVYPTPSQLVVTVLRVVRESCMHVSRPGSLPVVTYLSSLTTSVFDIKISTLHVRYNVGTKGYFKSRCTIYENPKFFGRASS